MALTIEQFKTAVIDSGLVSQAELAEMLAAAPAGERPGDTKALALWLVQRGKLTAYQANTIYQGKGKSLLFDDYVILDKIGSGGMGVVFQARHRRMERVVALKILPPSATKDPESVTRFLREVRAAARLHHPNIVTAFDAGEYQNVHFLVMEYVDGNNLSVLVKRGGPLAVGQAVDCIIQTARGLEHAHAEGVIHRDIKPANLLLDKRGVVKVLDMGLARFQRSLVESGATDESSVTDARYVSGTVDYMAPEQATKARDADQRVDIYSLGCTLYYLLTGQRVYQGGTVMDKLLAHQDQPIPSLQAARPDVPAALDAVFQRMLAKTARERYPSMSEVIAALEACRGAWSDASSPLPAAGRQVADEGQLANFFELLAAETQTGGGQSTEVVASAMTSSPTPVPAIAAGPGVATPRGVGRWLNHRPAQLVGAAVAVLLLMVIAGLSIGAAITGTPPAPTASPAKSPATPDAAPAAAVAETPPVPESRDARQPPARLRTPFGSDAAVARRDQWAQYLGVAAEQTNSLGTRLVLIPPGEFLMGSSEADARRVTRRIDQRKSEDEPNKNRSRNEFWPVDDLAAEQPQRRVTITQPFYLAVYEVTHEEFERVLQRNPSPFAKGGPLHNRLQTDDTRNLPVDGVSWADAVEFCNALSVAEGLPPYYEKVFWQQSTIVTRGGPGYRLPTEAEWEYACRAGSTELYAFGDALNSKQANLHARAGSVRSPNDTAASAGTMPVGSYPANAFGLFDMHGNVAEWCADWWSDTFYGIAADEDPVGPIAGEWKVARGGHWMAAAESCRSASRPLVRHRNVEAVIGFRVARNVAVEPTGEPQP